MNIRDYLYGNIENIFYGLGLYPNEDTLNELYNRMFNHLLITLDASHGIKVKDVLGNEVYAPCREVGIKLAILDELVKNPNRDIKTILLDSRYKFVIKDGSLYNNIDEEVGKILLKRGHSEYLFTLFDTKDPARILHVCPNVEFYTKYIKNEITFEKKKHLIDIHNDRYAEKLNHNRSNFVYTYMLRALTNSNYIGQEDCSDAMLRYNLDELAQSLNICAHDLTYRVAIQKMSLHKATELGKQERDNYNLVYMGRPFQVNIAAYDKECYNFLATMLKKIDNGEL